MVRLDGQKPVSGAGFCRFVVDRPVWGLLALGDLQKMLQYRVSGA
jgi:hypothetical protein